MSLHVVNRGLFEPIFVTQPQPLKLLVPPWIRPYEPLITLVAIDAQDYGADVRYVLESGKCHYEYLNGVRGRGTSSVCLVLILL